MDSLPSAGASGTLVRRRSWSERTFSRVQAGSVRGSIFSLCCSAIGMGVLLLPYTMAQVGPLCALSLLALAAIAGHASLQICCAGMQVTGTHSYTETLAALFSERVAAVLTLMLVVACFGLCCGYFVFASQLLQQLLQHAGVLCGRPAIVMVCAFCPVLPLSFFRNLSDFRYLTLVSLTGLSYLTLLVMCRSPHYYALSSGVKFSSFWYVPDVSAIPKCLSLCFTAYTVHMNVFACYDELQNPTSIRIKKVLTRSVMVQSVLYVSIASCGFLSFGLATPDNILRAYSLEDTWANVGRAFVSFQLLLSIPLTVHPGRKYFWSLLTLLKAPRRSDGQNRNSERRDVEVPPRKQQLAEENSARELAALPLAHQAPGPGGRADAGLATSLPQSAGLPHSLPQAADEPSSMTQFAFTSVTVSFVALSAVVAAKVESASDLLGVVGGFAAVTYAYLLPAEMAKKLAAQRRCQLPEGTAAGAATDSFCQMSPAPFERPAIISSEMSPAAFVYSAWQGPLATLGLRLCTVCGYVAAVQCARKLMSH